MPWDDSSNYLFFLPRNWCCMFFHLFFVLVRLLMVMLMNVLHKINICEETELWWHFLTEVTRVAHLVFILHLVKNRAWVYSAVIGYITDWNWAFKMPTPATAGEISFVVLLWRRTHKNAQKGGDIPLVFCTFFFPDWPKRLYPFPHCQSALRHTGSPGYTSGAGIGFRDFKAPARDLRWTVARFSPVALQEGIHEEIPLYGIGRVLSFHNKAHYPMILL